MRELVELPGEYVDCVFFQLMLDEPGATAERGAAR
jgi:hypothetical protein